MLLLSLMVMLSLGARMGFQMLPSRELPGIEEFRKEALACRLEMILADSLAAKASDSAYSRQAFTERAVRKITPLNINSVDSAALLPLPGIGPVFAGRIVKYRKLLGGFTCTDQLKEVYGMERATVERITPFLYIDSTLLRQVDLNSATFRELLRHPYLEYENVKALLRYRDVIGQISSFEELRQNAILPDSVLDKAVPYLEISPGFSY